MPKVTILCDKESDHDVTVMVVNPFKIKDPNVETKDFVLKRGDYVEISFNKNEEIILRDI